MRDELDELMMEVRVKAKREMKQAKKEAEAAERAERKSNFEALRSAFDSERFRWVAAHPTWLRERFQPSWDLEAWRNHVDLAIRQEHRQAK